MRIENILLNNYRQFKNIEFSFRDEKDNDLHIIIGKNGTGKTNILNAINWCLYGSEPHLSKDSKQLPILNLRAIEEANDGEDKEIFVEVHIKTQDKKNILFSRKAVFRVYKSENKIKDQGTDFEVLADDEKGNKEIIKGDQAYSYVQRFVPEAIKEFFFFDGERLDNYFREATVQNIRHAIFLISQIEILENKIERRIDEVLRELRKEAGKAHPKIEDTRNSLEQAEKKHKIIEKQIDECNEQIAIAKRERRVLDGKLRSVPDLDLLEQRKYTLKASKKHKKEIRDEKIKEMQDLLFETGRIIMIYPAIKMSLEKIEEKRKNKEIPPKIDKSLLEDILIKKICSICGTHLDKKLEEKINNLLNEIRLSSNINQQLVNIENPLNSYKEKVIDFNENLRKLTHEIKNYEKDLESIEQELGQIDKKMSGYEVDKVKEWYNQLKKFEEDLEINKEKAIKLGIQREDLNEKIDNLNKILSEELKNVEKVRKLKRQIEFCTKSLDVVKKTKEIIMKRTRKKIESETNKLFFQLLWKKETFKEVNIEENFDINLIHSMGFDCLGSISAAERELLALSFTLALHKISGFDSTILIDTPVARVSDEHRENFGRIFSEVSHNKQIILLFTPAEYSKDISKFLDIKSSNRFILDISLDEKESRLKEL